MRQLDAWHVEYPFAGSRLLRGLLRQEGSIVGRLHVATLMKRMGIMALYRRPATSHPTPGHQSDPTRLRKLAVTRPNQVWAMDSTSVPMARGFVYLGGGCRLVQPQGARVAALDGAGDGAVREGIERSAGLVWPPRDSEHGSGQPVHLSGLSQGVADRPDRDQHGRPGRVARQCPCRTALADAHRRGRLPPGLPKRLGGASRAGPLCGIRQPAPPAFLTWRANARSGIFHPANANPGGGITSVAIHLLTAHNLFKIDEPPLRNCPFMAQNVYF